MGASLEAGVAGAPLGTTAADNILEAGDSKEGAEASLDIKVVGVPLRVTESLAG